MMNNYDPNESFINDRESKRNFVRNFIDYISLKINDMKEKVTRMVNMSFPFVLFFCLINTFLCNYDIILATIVMYFSMILALNVKIIIYNLKLEEFNRSFRRENKIKLDLFNF